MESKDFKLLFNQILSTNARYSKINELTGENFNVFRILKLESSEVRMHSSFIAELLNPKGCHGQKDVFLKLFINSLCFKQNVIDTASCKVEVEKHTGKINDERTEGGRIDILITDKDNNQIIVENKIYAGDQHNQLLRYFKHSPKADLIYLSLNGKEPEEYSKGILESGKDYQCRSYSTHISDWLEVCRKEVAVLPIIRESITQYINLIKYLTNQTLNDSMKEEVAQILSNNLEASFIIADNIDEALKIVLEKFYVQLDKVAEELGLNFEENIDFRFKANFRGFNFRKTEWKNVGLTFQFWGYDTDLTYGFTAMEDINNKDYPKKLNDALDKQFKNLVDIKIKENSWWPLHLKMEDPYRNWGKYEAWKAIEDGVMANNFKEKINYLLDLAKNIEL